MGGASAAVAAAVKNSKLDEVKTTLASLSNEERALLQAALACRTFTASDAKGGCDIVPGKTACIFIEYQNEFTTEGGKLHDGCKAVMEETGMLDKSAEVAKTARAAGIKIMHTPITFAEDASDNPNKGLGILKGCA